MDEVLESALGWLKRGRALDVGCGEGELMVELARLGYRVEGVDLSATAAAKAAAQCHNAGVEAKVHLADLHAWRFPVAGYELITAVSSLHFCTPAALESIAPRLAAALRPGGAIFALVLTSDDPAYAEMSRTEPAIAPDTFWLDRHQTALHFFGPHELRRRFDGLKVRHYSEERRLDTERAAGYRSVAVLLAVAAGR
jgi:cyclopropane fatty-acyl-phospholipid synthase-like methyltransferase